MPNIQQRGLDSSQEQRSETLIRDTRTIGQRISDFLQDPGRVAMVLAFLGCVGFLFPAIVDIIFIISIFLFWYGRARHFTLPFRMPKRAHVLDYNTPKAGSTKPSMSDGIYFFGNDRKTDDELWFTNSDMRTHGLIFGSTGSGKTEALISIAYNALVQGSGFIYVDGKGDNSLFAKIFSLVRMMGREDDLLLINFMTGAKDIIGAQEKRISNTMNPFSSGSSSMLSQLVVSLMGGSEGGSGDMWKGRAIAFVEALMRVLVYMRDQGSILLDANTIRNYFDLERLEVMVLDKVFIRDDQEAVSIEDAPKIIMEPMKNYLNNLPGYNKEKKGKQVSQVLEQHGYITMQLTRAFSSLADTYGHILRTDLPEVDLRDVVLNRRILVVLLPALEKAPEELANLGKIVIASLKTMMAAGLGDEVEGTYNEVIERKPTNARNPYLCILDEYGYYAVQGFAVVPAQARSLGFSVIFAGQDLPAFQKASKEEAASIGANTNIKMCMKLEDPMETWDFFMKSAGEAQVAVAGSFQKEGGSYMDTKSAQFEKRSRISLLDLKEQREGEYHIFFKSRIVRGKAFFANPKPVKELRLNQFVKVDVPTDAMLRSLISGFDSFKKIIKEGAKVFEEMEIPEDAAKKIADLFAEQEGDPIEKSLGVLMAFCESEEAEEALADERGLVEGELDVFSKLTVSDYLKSLLLVDNLDEFSEPILSRAAFLEKTVYVESAVKDARMAKSVSKELIRDMRSVTHYPPEVNIVFDSGEIASSVEEIVELISLD